MRLKQFINSKIEHLLPVELVSEKQDQKVFISISMQRSGQHAILQWLCMQMEHVIHFNNCTFVQKNLRKRLVPVTGRVVQYDQGEINDSGTEGKQNIYKLLSKIYKPYISLYSLENYNIVSGLNRLKKITEKYNPIFLIILRDPYNWLASIMSHHASFQSDERYYDRLLQIYKSYAAIVLEKNTFIGSPFYFINYNQWYNSRAYRYKICEDLGLHYVTDKTLDIVPDFGGGSSFDKTSLRTKAHEMKVLERWKNLSQDITYKKIVTDKGIEHISQKLFDLNLSLHFK